MLKDLDTSSAKVAFDLGLDAVPEKLFDLLVCTIITHEHAIEGIVLNKGDLSSAISELPVCTRREWELYRSIRNLRMILEYIFYLNFPDLDLYRSQVASLSDCFDESPLNSIPRRKSGESSIKSPISRAFSDLLFLIQTSETTDLSDVSFREVVYRARPTTPGPYHLNVIPMEEVEEALDEMFEEYNENFSKLHPVETAARLHFRFMEIFPYDETTGFIGRALVNAHLMWCDTPPAIIFQTDRQDYFQGLSGTYTDLIDLYVSAINHSEKVCRKALE